MKKETQAMRLTPVGSTGILKSTGAAATSIDSFRSPSREGESRAATSERANRAQRILRKHDPAKHAGNRWENNDENEFASETSR
jgi:hypothetical protein